MEKFSLLDEKYMKKALVEAQKAYDLDEVPVGAVLVLENGECFTAHNLVESSNTAFAHAEVLCIQKATEQTGDWRLAGSTLYITLEPCIMCSGLIILSRIKKVVWGCPDPRHGASGSLVNLFSEKHPIHQVESLGGLLEEDSKVLMQSFFQLKREESRARKQHRDGFNGTDRTSEKEAITSCEGDCSAHHGR